MEGSGDELVLEDHDKPCGEKDKRGAPVHPDGCVKNGDLRHGESDAPEHLGEAEKERQILEAVDVVPAFSEVGLLQGKAGL